jgi:hypothetical protein
MIHSERLENWSQNGKLQSQVKIGDGIGGPLEI